MAKKVVTKKAAVKKPAAKKSVSADSLVKLSKDPAAEKRRMLAILEILRREYPEAKCSLDFNSPFQLLVATMLSAQTTDERVNKVTPALFAKFPTPGEMAAAPLKEIEKLIQSTNFYRNKAIALKTMSNSLLEEHGGAVPRTLDELVKLRGVGRKTANVVLGNVFDVPGMVVDTHVGRIARRLGFTKNDDPVKVESDLEKVTPREDWTELAHLFIAHGRAICTARRAKCEECPVARFCPKIGV
ncbi:MAG: endonuclease III [Bdellovibrionia bacterium]